MQVFCLFKKTKVHSFGLDTKWLAALWVSVHLLFTELATRVFDFSFGSETVIKPQQ